MTVYNVGGVEAADIEVEDEWEEDKFTLTDGSMRAAFPSLSKEDKAERRKAKLKEVAEGSKKASVLKTVTREEEETVPTLRAASNKTNKTQALLAALKDDSTPTRQPKKLPSLKPPPV